MIPIKTWMKQLPPDAQKLLSEHFWDLANSEPIEPKVLLTIEEAKELMKLLDLCEYWLTNNNVSYDCDVWASLLEERIEKVEGK